jgi:hypothetical protein
MSEPHKLQQLEGYYLGPFAGLQIHQDSVVLGDLNLIKPSREEWMSFERDYIVKDWYAYYYNVNPVFALCPVRDVHFNQVEILDIEQKTLHLITALRIYKHGYVLDPAYTLRIFSDGKYFNRMVGPYRNDYITAPLDGLMYELLAEDYPVINGLYQQLKKSINIPASNVLHNIFHQFNLSYLAAMGPYFTLNILYTCFEMLFGRISPKTCSSTHMYDRARLALEFIYGDLYEDWYNFFTLKIHSMRNIVHHHKENGLDISLDEAVIFLREPIRIGLRLLLKLYITWSEHKILQVRQNYPKQISPKELLNVAIERFSQGDTSLIAELNN